MHIVSVSSLGGLVAAGLIVLGTLGCGQDDGLITLTGAVTLDGEPVEEGSISLMPVDGKGIAGGGIISNGQYTAKSSPGEMAVQIYATKTIVKENPTQEEIERDLTETQIQLMPAVYNQASELRIHVSPEERNFDFNLTKDGKVPEELAKKM